MYDPFPLTNVGFQVVLTFLQGALLNVGVWTVIELHIAIVVGSLPPCRNLIIRLWNRMRGKKPQSSSNAVHTSNLHSSSNSYWSKAAASSGTTSAAKQDGWIKMDPLGFVKSQSSQNTQPN
jgi:hypothetical protein